MLFRRYRAIFSAAASRDRSVRGGKKKRPSVASPCQSSALWPLLYSLHIITGKALLQGTPMCLPCSSHWSPLFLPRSPLFLSSYISAPAKKRKSGAAAPLSRLPEFFGDHRADAQPLLRGFPPDPLRRPRVHADAQRQSVYPETVYAVPMGAHGGQEIYRGGFEAAEKDFVGEKGRRADCRAGETAAFPVRFTARIKWAARKRFTAP